MIAIKDFKLNNGDIDIFNNDIEMINGSEVTRQKVEKVIGTNKGEWFLNGDEGIDFDVLWSKDTTQKASEKEDKMYRDVNERLNDILQAQNEKIEQ